MSNGSDSRGIDSFAGAGAAVLLGTNMTQNKSLPLKALISCLFLLIGSRVQDVDCDEIEERLYRVNQKILKAKFHQREEVNILFYDRKLDTEKADPVLRNLAAHMAKSRAVMGASQKRGLHVILQITKKYFIDKWPPLDANLIRNKHLLDMIMYRSIAGSIEQGFYAIDRERRHIYLLLKQYLDRPGVLLLAKDYYETLSRTESLENKAQRGIKTELDLYREQDQVEQKDPVRILTVVDDLITKIDKRMDQPESEFDDATVYAKYFDPRLRNDVWKVFSQTRLSVRQYSVKEIDSVRVNDMLAFEDKVGGSFEFLKEYEAEFEQKLEQLNQEMRRALQVVFYEHREAAADRQLISVLSQTGRMTALMYAAERKMLTELRYMVLVRTETFVHLHLVEPELIDLIETRLRKHAVHAALDRFVRDRKCLHMQVDKYYRRRDNIRQIACEYFKVLQKRRGDVVRMQQSLEAHQSRIAARRQPVPESVLKVVSDLVDGGIDHWQLSADEMRLLRMYVDKPVFDDLQEARRTFNKIFKPGPGALDAVSDGDMARLERELSGGRAGTNDDHNKQFWPMG